MRRFVIIIHARIDRWYIGVFSQILRFLIGMASTLVALNHHTCHNKANELILNYLRPLYYILFFFYLRLQIKIYFLDIRTKFSVFFKTIKYSKNFYFYGTHIWPSSENQCLQITHWRIFVNFFISESFVAKSLFAILPPHLLQCS